jgi:hypothetical protein
MWRSAAIVLPFVLFDTGIPVVFAERANPNG